jgi:hypothetical protein
MNLDEKILRIISNKEIVSEKNAENKDLLEEIHNEMARKGLTEHVVNIPFTDGHFVVVKLRKQKKKAVDKTSLAQQAEVDKSELDLVGISRLTKEGVITPQMIEENTTEQFKQTVKVKRRKPRKKGGKKRV